MTQVLSDRPRRTNQPAPELVGAVLAVVVVAIVAVTAFASGPASPTAPDGGSAGPSLPRPSPRPTPEPPVDPAVVALLGAINDRIGATGDALDGELARTELRTGDVAHLIRQLNMSLSVGIEAVGALDGALGPEEVGGRLAAVYASLSETADETLAGSIENEAGYRAGAAIIAKQIKALPSLQTQLEDLLVQPTASAPPASPSPAPSASAPPQPATPSATATPSGSPVASPSPGASGAEQVVNGGFESGVGQPWGLYLREGASARLAVDSTKPGAGTNSARVEVTVGSPAYSGISLRQSGLLLEAGRAYTLSVMVRSAAEREIRVRVASRDGASSLNRLERVSSTWRSLSYTFTVGVGDPDGVLQLDLGRAEGTLWFDSVSFRAIGG